MPKDTFFNLDPEKRALISQVALSEFAQYSFEAASINRIVANSGIAKGSFYQYFEDKKDLFLYLVDVVAQEKARYLAPVMANANNSDLFSLLRELYISGIRFAKEYPQYAKIGDDLFRHRSSPVYQEIFEKNLPVAYEFFESLLQDAISRGNVRKEINVKMFAYIIATMNALVVDYHLAGSKKPFGEDMMDSIDEFIEFLRCGIGEKGPSLAGNSPAKMETVY